MTNRSLLLGRSKPSEKLTREEIAALDKVPVPPAPAAKPTGKKGGGLQRTVLWFSRHCLRSKGP